MTDLAQLDSAPYAASTIAKMANASIDVGRRPPADGALVIPIACAAVLLFTIDISVALRGHDGGKALATLAASGAGLFAGPISSDACRARDDQLDRAAMRVLLSAP